MHSLNRFGSGILLAGTLGVVAAAVFGASLMGATQSPSPAPLARALVVRVIEATESQGYSLEHRYVGRVESARSSELAFELAGLVSEVRPEEGESVEAGTLVARLDTARLRARRDELEADRERAQADLDLAQLTADRHRTLVDEDVISSQRWDETRKRRDALAAQMRRIEAGIAAVDVELDKSVLRAPFSGRISNRYVDEGSVVSAGAPVLRLLESTRLEVRVGLAPRNAADVSTSAVLSVRIADRIVEAPVRAVLPVLSQSTRTVDLILSLPGGFDARDGDLAELLLPQQRDGVGYWLPARALTESSRGLWSAYVAEPLAAPRGQATHRIARRLLEVNHQEADRVFVRGALRDGDAVVAEGIQRLVPGQLVRPVAGGA